MNIQVKFLGAAGTVTGSRYLIEAGSTHFLVDCGLFQGTSDIRARNWDDFPVNPLNISCVVLTHAHIDHTGYLPRLVKEGFSGSIYCTEPTGDLLEIMLLDSAKLQEEDTEWAIKKGYSRHSNPKPLYTEEDARKVFPQIRTYKYHQPFKIANHIEVTYYDAGHLLGSAITKITIKGDTQTKTLLFSGDLGRYNTPMLNDPEAIDYADILFIESTYGNRDNPFSDPKPQLTKIINETFQKNGVVLIPSFAIGRSQLVLYYLKQLMNDNVIPDIPVYLDSPMAISSSALYFKYPEYHKIKASMDEYLKDLETNMLVLCRTSEFSRQLNEIKNNAIIVSSSGMMNGGRIMHHLYHRLPREQDTVLIVGHQGEGTRGRQILEGAEKVMIFGQEVPVKCRVEYIPSFSGHADKAELFKWMSNFKDKPKRVFTTHGETSEMIPYAEAIRAKFGWNVSIPEFMESVRLFESI